MATNLQPYKTSLLKPGYHYVVADNGIEYVCFFALFDYFFKDYPSIASKVFAFNIELLNKDDIDKQKGTDKRLALTIVCSSKNFFPQKSMPLFISATIQMNGMQYALESLPPGLIHQTITTLYK